MTRLRLFVVSATILALFTPSVAQEGAVGNDDFLSNPSVFEATLEAPFHVLLAHGRRDPDFTVTGRLAFTSAGRRVSIEGITIGLRGHTSLQEGECPFPKLKLDLPRERAGLLPTHDKLTVGTHCAERADGDLTPKYGRWANQKAPHREAAVYRLTAAMGIPSPLARPARLTYVFTGTKETITRNAFLLEDFGRLMQRAGATGLIDERAFSSAREAFTTADAARIAFAQALIGNFDWCLRFYPEDSYRCNQRHPLWNVLALKTRTGLVPAIYDFDLSALVTGRHSWFATIFNPAFSKSPAEIEVTSQLQRARSLFTRAQLDATRREFARKKTAAYAAVTDSPLDEGWASAIQAYLNAFFEAMENDEKFYLPVVVAPDARFFMDAAGKRPACNSDKVPIGTVIGTPLDVQYGRMRGVVLDSQWYWTSPRKCDVIRTEPVWIAVAAVSRDYPR